MPMSRFMVILQFVVVLERPGELVASAGRNARMLTERNTHRHHPDCRTQTQRPRESRWQATSSLREENLFARFSSTRPKSRYPVCSPSAAKSLAHAACGKHSATQWPPYPHEDKRVARHGSRIARALSPLLCLGEVG